METTTITLYHTRDAVLTEQLDLEEFSANLHYAISRFSNSERRSPAAIIIPLQVARNLQVVLVPLLGELYSVGTFDSIPLLAREAYLDPLFLLI
jgi:hypothetical protein